MVEAFDFARSLVVGFESVGDVAEAVRVIVEHDRSEDDVVEWDVLGVERLHLEELSRLSQMFVIRLGDLHHSDGFAVGPDRVRAAAGLDGGKRQQEIGRLTGQLSGRLEVAPQLFTVANLFRSLLLDLDADLLVDEFLETRIPRLALPDGDGLVVGGLRTHATGGEQQDEEQHEVLGHGDLQKVEGKEHQTT